MAESLQRGLPVGLVRDPRGKCFAPGEIRAVRLLLACDVWQCASQRRRWPLGVGFVNGTRSRWARVYARSMNVESCMSTMRGSSMGGVSSRVMSSPKRSTFGRLFDKRPDAPCVAHGVNASPVVDLHGDLLVADLEHEVQSGSLGGVGTRSMSKPRMTDAVAPSTLWAMCPASVVSSGLASSAPGARRNPFLPTNSRAVRGPPSRF